MNCFWFIFVYTKQFACNLYVIVAQYRHRVFEDTRKFQLNIMQSVANQRLWFKAQLANQTAAMSFWFCAIKTNYGMSWQSSRSVWYLSMYFSRWLNIFDWLVNYFIYRYFSGKIKIGFDPKLKNILLVITKYRVNGSPQIKKIA